MSLLFPGGVLRPLVSGSTFYVAWYHPQSPLFRTDRGLFIEIDASETYYGTHELCHAAIRRDHLASGGDFCVKMIAVPPGDGEGKPSIARAVSGQEGLDAVREHVRSENHVYGADAGPGQVLWVPPSMLDASNNHAVRAGRRYDLQATPISSACVRVQDDGRTAHVCPAPPTPLSSTPGTRTRVA